jgi:hypothetical protein
VQALLEAGLSGAEIARRLGISKSAVSYHKRRLGHPIDARCNPALRLGGGPAFLRRGPHDQPMPGAVRLRRKTFMDAVPRGVLISRPQAAPVGEYLVRAGA